MIPIQCPQCGRRGHVPPDMFGAKFHCKGCHTIFRLDHLGRLELAASDEVAEAAEAASRPRPKPRPAAPPGDLAGAWREVPRPARLGAPAACVVLLGWMLLPASKGPTYQERAEAIGRAVGAGDRPGVVEAATPGSAEAAGRWFDLVRAPIEGGAPAAGGSVTAGLLAGNPERDSAIEMCVLVVTDRGSTTFNLPLVKEGGRWLVDGSRSLDEARKSEPISLARAKAR